MNDKNPINLSSAYPITDEEGKSLIPYEFTITNTCNSFASYQINLEILNTTTLENLEYLKVMLDSKVNLLTENESVTKTLENAKTSYKLESGYLRENKSKTFSLRLWMGEDTPTKEEFMNKLFESKVTVIATYKENLDNNIEVNAMSQNESFSGSETFQIHVTSESFDLVSMSEDLETWEELENKGKEITVEKTVTTNGSHTFYFQDEAENIQDITVTATKIDDKKPTANMSVAKTNNVIKIDASSSKDNETSVVKYYYSKDGINYEESTNNKFQFTDEYEYGVATTMLTSFERNQIKKVYLKVEDEIGNISDVKELPITETDFAYDKTADNNLRYIGANPNNYIDIGDRDEIGSIIPWRIIGVMNNVNDGLGNKAPRIKIIRGETIGEFSWDTSISSINYGNGINEWSQADAMKLMNPGYESESVGGSLYWNRESGTCYNGKNNATTSCDFKNSGLSESAKSIIGNALWHTGSNGTDGSYDNIKTTKFYELERSNNIGKICGGVGYCTDTISRTTTWTGKIGLMYPSDYGYATSGGITTSRETCLNMTLYNWEKLSASDCKTNNWLYDSNYYQWTLMPYAHSTHAYDSFFVATSGGAAFIYDNGAWSVRPAVYLIENTKISNGDGLNNMFKVEKVN